MKDLIREIIDLKNQYIEKSSSSEIIKEFIPKEWSEKIPIKKEDLEYLDAFFINNLIYQKIENISLGKIESKSYMGDINYYWLNAKKNENNYQPFYPTWVLSAYVLCNVIKHEGFLEIIDIGSGDGRIPYCGKILDIRSISVEIDKDLSELQKEIMTKTGVIYEMINNDATTFQYKQLNLSRPMVCISALPEIGEILATEIISSFRELSKINNLEVGFCFIGNNQQTRNQFKKDDGYFGWSAIIKKFGLKIFKQIELPTHWTNDVKYGTNYLLTK